MNKNKNKVSLKMMSIGLILPIALASHLLDIPFIVLYSLVGLGLLIWLIDFIILMVKKKNKYNVLLKDESCSDDEMLCCNKDGKPVKIEYYRSFQARLSHAQYPMMDFYNELKNHVLTYKGVTSHMAWGYDALSYKGKDLIRFAFMGKTVVVYLPLDEEKLDHGIYDVEKVTSKEFEKVSCLYRIYNLSRLNLAKELLDMVAKQLKLEKLEHMQAQDYRLPYEDDSLLLEKGWIKEVLTPLAENEKGEGIFAISSSQADKMMSNQAAIAKIEEDTFHKHNLYGRHALVHTDTIAMNYADGEMVDINSLKEKKLIPEDATYVQVDSRGILDKKLTFAVDEYSLSAVKMILLVGGRTLRIV